MKRCPKCERALPEGEFTKASRNSDGLAPYCRACTKIVNRAFYLKNRQYNIERSAEWKRANPKRRKEYQETWYSKNREHVAQYGKTNRERQYAAAKEYRERHPERCRARYAERHARMRVAPWANKSAIEAIYKRAAMLSLITGIPHEVDHIVPLRSKHVNGLHCETNLQILTRAANRKKANHFNAAMAA